MLVFDERAGTLATKLRPPVAPTDLLRRERLTDAILSGLARPLTLICAPAGFGKTTALAAALDAGPYPVAWLSLDEGDDDPATFLRHLVAAIQTQAPEACQSTLGLLQLPSLPVPAFIGRTLAEDLAALPAPLVVVLDDYHCIGRSDIHALLGALLRWPPPALHLVVASRTAAHLPLARLRAAEQLAELDLAHLRFTADETQDFLERATGTAVPADEAAGIRMRMGGWAVGLRLASIARRDWADSPAAVPTVAERTDRYTEEYLLEEVIDRELPGAGVRPAHLDRPALLRLAGRCSAGWGRQHHPERAHSGTVTGDPPLRPGPGRPARVVSLSRPVQGRAAAAPTAPGISGGNPRAPHPG